MTPKGFLFSTAEAEIKSAGRKDLALIYSQAEANIAGTFTTNRVKAAPVRIDMKKIRTGRGQAIIINSGNANACTGKKGIHDAVEMINLVSKGLNIKPSLVYACSTGVIGQPMPMDRISPKISELIINLGASSLADVAQAIMTTDSSPKIVQRQVPIEKKRGSIVAICKGAGMIWPHMATMLCFILTDISIDQKILEKALHDIVEKTFNRITIDGEMSTNDTVLLMANGVLGNNKIKEKSKAYTAFKQVLYEITFELSRLIVQDGEGATKTIDIEVKGARSETDAKRAAFSVANSSLVKTAIYGNDANWGRIMAALGYSGIKLHEEKTDIFFDKVKIVHRGTGTGREKDAEKKLKERVIKIIIDLHNGKSSARVLTCDLTEDYIRTNATYRT